MSKGEHPIEKILVKDKLFWEFYHLFLKFLDQWPTDLPRSVRNAVTPALEDLASIFYYYHTKGETPSRESLTGAMEFNPSHFQERVKLYSPTFAEHLEKSFNLAMEELRISENTRKLTGETKVGHSQQTTEVAGKKRTPPKDVTMRRGIIKSVEKQYPSSKGQDLDLLSCKELDNRRIEVPNKWPLKYKVKTWVGAYGDSEVKKLIHKMFSEDRKKG